MDSKLLIIIAIAAVILLIASAVLRKAIGADRVGDARVDAYQLVESLFTPAERSFFGVLKNLDYDGLTVVAKVRLADIFDIKKGLGRAERQRALNRVSAKHVDFLFIRETDGRPVLGIELDDASHQRADRKIRDRFVEDVFAAAGLPLVRFPVKRSYSVQEVHAALEKALVVT
ncbi:MAG: DUF2726 domain-containing protein [Nibricoccus sp.]